MLSTFRGETLSWSLDRGVLEVELHRKPCNEIGTATLVELERLARTLRHDAGRSARALVISSSLESGFCAGADLREFHAGLIAGDNSMNLGAAHITWKQAARALAPSVRALAHAAYERTRERRSDIRALTSALPQMVKLRAFLDRIHAVFDTLDTAPLTTVAAVHGVVFGGGFELALTCDVIVADKSARFCFPELRLGLIPGFGGIPRLTRNVGNSLVRDLLLTGRSIRATRAHEVGLVSQLTGKGEALAVAREVAAQACRFDAGTARAAKVFMKPLPRAELAREKQVFCELFTSPAVRQGLDRFVNSDDIMPYQP